VDAVWIPAFAGMSGRDAAQFDFAGGTIFAGT